MRPPCGLCTSVCGKGGDYDGTEKDAVFLPEKLAL